MRAATNVGGALTVRLVVSGTSTEASTTGSASECGDPGLNGGSAQILTLLVRDLRRYVYDYIGGDHDKIFRELLATLCTFAVTTLWLGPCEVVYIWSVLNCFGLNFELWVAKLFSLPPFSTVEVSDTGGRRPFRLL